MNAHMHDRRSTLVNTQSTPASHQDGGYLTAVEVAERLAITVGTLANWRSKGLGPPCIKLGMGGSGRIRYALRDLQVWESSRVSTRDCGVR